MANETANEFTSAINNLMETAGKLGQMQVELVSSVAKAFTEVLEPLSQTSTELVGNVVNNATQLLQDVSAAITSKK